MKKLIAGAVVLTTSALASHALAQAAPQSAFDRDRNVSVRERPHPEYAAVGLPAGGFMVFPRVTADVQYDDNVFAVANNTDSDWIFRVRPEVRVDSNWSRNALEVYARASINRYVQFKSENTNDWVAGGSGRLDVIGASYLFAGGDYGEFTESRTAATTPFDAAKPVQYFQATANVGAVQEANRWRFTERGDFANYDYQDTPMVGGGTIVESDRNFNLARGTGKIEYAVSPNTALFVQGSYNNRNYKLNTPQRDSTGYEVTAGANFDLSHLARGEVQLGYLKQSYKDSVTFPDVSGLAVHGRVDWFPTQLTTVTFTANRAIQDWVVTGSAGTLSTDLGAQVDHELMRNVILSANGGWGHDQYQGIDRDDNRWTVGASVNYLLNRHVGVQLAYNHFNQSSKGLASGADFSVNTVLASLTFQY